MDELIARIASLIRRYTRFNQQAGTMQKLDFDGLQIDLENRSVTTANGTFELPPKEFDLLLYCAKHQGKILTKQQSIPATPHPASMRATEHSLMYFFIDPSLSLIHI